MDISTETLLAAGGIITGVSALISTIIVARRAARKDAVASLQAEVERLQTRADAQDAALETARTKYDRLYTYVLQLRKVISDLGGEVPEMPPIYGEVNIPYEGYKKPNARRSKIKPLPPEKLE